MRRIDSNRVGHPRAAERSFGDMTGAAVDGLTARECSTARGGHGMHIVRVRIVEVVSAGIENVDVANVSVMDVDVSDVSAAAVVPREEWFAPA